MESIDSKYGFSSYTMTWDAKMNISHYFFHHSDEGTFFKDGNYFHQHNTRYFHSTSTRQLATQRKDYNKKTGEIQ